MTSASTWRDAEPEQFAAALLAAAEQLGVLPLAVEKDYWVCQTLRAITTAHPSEVAFKGGTSLEKLRISRRFSEDLDLLVVGDYASSRAVERALKSMVQVDGPAAASALLNAPSGERSGGLSGGFHRSAYISPPMTHSAVPGAIADASAILIELGRVRRPQPSRDRTGRVAPGPDNSAVRLPGKDDRGHQVSEMSRRIMRMMSGRSTSTV